MLKLPRIHTYPKLATHPLVGSRNSTYPWGNVRSTWGNLCLFISWRTPKIRIIAAFDHLFLVQKVHDQFASSIAWGEVIARCRWRACRVGWHNWFYMFLRCAAVWTSFNSFPLKRLEYRTMVSEDTRRPHRCLCTHTSMNDIGCGASFSVFLNLGYE